MKRYRTAEYTGIERRSGQDRRKQQRSLLKSMSQRGSRLSARRAEDRQKIIVFDRYRPSLFIIIIIVLGLSLLDALLTLILVSRGAIEINPIMDYYLSQGPKEFVIVKYGLTVFSILIILVLNDVLKSRYRLGTGALMYLFATIFGSVVIWQFTLLSI